VVQLICGYGEVGQALHKVLGNTNRDVYWMTRSKDNLKEGRDMRFDVVHICFPYSEDFEKEVAMWKDNADLVIVHSSVPVGTCDSLGAVHSPITGVHPHLEVGIKTFVKYFGGARAIAASRIFQDLGIRTKTYQKAAITEAMKLWSTTQYGRMIMLEKEIYEWCQKNNLPFSEVYERSNHDYNEGYTKLGMSNVVRPILKHVPGEIGGHCVVNNSKLLGVKL
jgi:UDP-N-acetyl-D-mannosaminuronate dehydrogenase